jgi:hypothetical protein
MHAPGSAVKVLLSLKMRMGVIMTDDANPGDHPDFAAARETMGELLGIARGLLADAELSDDETHFLKQWLENRSWIASSFPGNVIYERVSRVLEDGVITLEERSHLVNTLQQLIDDRLEDLAEKVELTELWFDEASQIHFDSARFCLTGNFAYGPKVVCKTAIEQRGGRVEPSVVGSLGVDEWRTGGLGVEIEAAMRIRAQGKALKIIPEDSWVASLK